MISVRRISLPIDIKNVMATKPQSEHDDSSCCSDLAMFDSESYAVISTS